MASGGKKTVKKAASSKPAAKRSTAQRVSRPASRREREDIPMKSYPLGFGVFVFVVILLLFILIAVSVALGRMSAGN